MTKKFYESFKIGEKYGTMLKRDLFSICKHSLFHYSPGLANRAEDEDTFHVILSMHKEKKKDDLYFWHFIW
jgi:hypothetical protein